MVKLLLLAKAYHDFRVQLNSSSLIKATKFNYFSVISDRSVNYQKDWKYVDEINEICLDVASVLFDFYSALVVSGITRKPVGFMQSCCHPIRMTCMLLDDMQMMCR